MQIVIDIPEEEYGFYISQWAVVANGTPLPKGHGRLIDEKDVISILLHECSDRVGRYLSERIDEVPTVIETDKE